MSDLRISGSTMIERVLIAGLGSIGRRHLTLVRELLPHADIRVLRREHGDSLPDGANGVFTSISEAASFSPQFSIVANPAPFHLPIAIGLAQAGSHLLVEKPISDSVAGVRELLQCVAERRLRLQLAYNLRYLPSLQQFRQCVQHGLVGRVHSIRCEVGQYLPDWRPGQDYRLAVSAQHALGGGALLELSHELDYLRWIFGEVEWLQSTMLRQGDLEIDVEDSVHLLMGFVAGADGKSAVANVSLDFARRNPTRYCMALGTQGSVRWNGIAGTVSHFDPQEGKWNEIFSHVPARNETYRKQLEIMLDGIASGAEVPIGGVDGLAVMQCIEAARISSDDGGRRVGVSR